MTKLITMFSLETQQSKGVWRQHFTFNNEEAAKNYARREFPPYVKWRIRQFRIEDKSDKHLETT